jgi:integrase
MSRTASGTVGWRGNPARWWARITVKDEQGTAHRPWVDLERPDLKNTPEDKRTAKRLALKRAKFAAKAPFVGVERATAPRVTLAELEEKWHRVLDADPHLKTSSRTTYKSCVKSRAIPDLGSLPISGLTVPVLRAWVRKLCDEIEPSTVRNHAIALTRFLGDARAEGWVTLDANPMKHEDVRALLPSVEAPDPDEIVKFTRDQAEALVARPELPHERFGLYLAALLAGLRAGELRGLTFAHLELAGSAPAARVRQQRALKRSAEDEERMTSPKSRTSKRDVPLHPAIVTWLAWWRDEGWSARYGRERTDADAVFPNVKGEAGRPRDPDILRRDLEEADLPQDFVTPDGERLPFTFHAFRRTFAAMLAESGVSVEIIGMLAGHAGKNVTERHYMGRSLEAMARAISTLRLSLPERPGVAAVPPSGAREASSESSRVDEARPETVGKMLIFQAVSQEHPMLLPQFRHSQPEPDVKAHGTREKQADRGDPGVAETLANRDGSQRTATLANKGGTLRDETRDGQVNPTVEALEGALARALDAVTAAGRFDLVDRILAEIERRRG